MATMQIFEVTVDKILSCLNKFFPRRIIMLILRYEVFSALRMIPLFFWV
jgi:hypothetical protein